MQPDEQTNQNPSVPPATDALVNDMNLPPEQREANAAALSHGVIPHEDSSAQSGSTPLSDLQEAIEDQTEESSGADATNPEPADSQDGTNPTE